MNGTASHSELKLIAAVCTAVALFFSYSAAVDSADKMSPTDGLSMGL